MELIFYREAADLLGVSVDTLTHAVRRNTLTKAGHKGKNMLLIKEQVMLFTGTRNGRKKWISLQDLTPEEFTTWKHYQSEGLQAFVEQAGVGQWRAKPPLSEEALDEIIAQKVKTQFLQQEAARLRREEDTAREKRERLEKENPFLMAV